MTVYIIITMVRLVDSIGAWIESITQKCSEGIGHRGAKGRHILHVYRLEQRKSEKALKCSLGDMFSRSPKQMCKTMHTSINIIMSHC